MHYYGVTSNPKNRWGYNGIQYRDTSLYTYIEKFGWDNIQHIVLYENLSYDDALKIEDSLIISGWEKGNCINKRRSGNVSKDDVYIREYQREYQREYKREYYEQNKDKLNQYSREYQREYCQKNKDKRREQMKQYQEQNKDKKRDYDREYYEKNKDKRREQMKQYQEQNKDKLREYQREYQRQRYQRKKLEKQLKEVETTLF